MLLSLVVADEINESRLIWCGSRVAWCPQTLPIFLILIVFRPFRSHQWGFTLRLKRDESNWYVCYLFSLAQLQWNWGRAVLWRSFLCTALVCHVLQWVSWKNFRLRRFLLEFFYEWNSILLTYGFLVVGISSRPKSFSVFWLRTQVAFVFCNKDLSIWNAFSGFLTRIFLSWDRIPVQSAGRWSVLANAACRRTCALNKFSKVSVNVNRMIASWSWVSSFSLGFPAWI